MDYTDHDKHRILLELRYVYTEDQLCQKWKLTKSQIRKWKKAANFAYLSADFRQLVILALHNGTGEIAKIISYLDYLDHTVYTEQEIQDALNSLKNEGIAKQDADGRWSYDLNHSQNNTSFIF